MTTDLYDARTDPDVLLLSPFYTDEFLGSRALAYIRRSDNLPLRLPPDEAHDPLCLVKLFDPVTRIWLATYDPVRAIGFGVGEMMDKDGPCREAGDFDLREIISLRGPMGVIMERDLYYRPRRLSDILEHGEDV
jgi:Protein of unknown function (DUF2958)